MLSQSEYLERLYGLLPKNFRNEDVKNNYQLKRYLDILVEGGLYQTYTESHNLLSLIDFDTVPVQFLPQLASSLGFKFPHDLDEQTQRSYVKYAVRSYKIKGTKKALEFMIRELTRFKTDLEIDEVNKILNVVLEVDMNRQGFERILDKVSFIVNEYAPPYKEFNLINRFIFDEPAWIIRKTEEVMTTIRLTTDLIRDKWFITLEGLTNDLNYLVSAEVESIQIYNRDEEHTDKIIMV